MKLVQYLGVSMGFLYLLGGAWLLFAPYIFNVAVNIPNANIFGGLLMGYGIFRMYRFYTQYKNEVE